MAVRQLGFFPRYFLRSIAIVVFLAIAASCGKDAGRSGGTTVRPRPTPTATPAAGCNTSLQSRVRKTLTACYSAASNPQLSSIVGGSCFSKLDQLNPDRCSGLSSRVSAAVSACKPLFATFSSFLRTECRQNLEPFLGK